MIAHAPGRSRDREWSFCRADLPDRGFRNRDLQARLPLFDFPQAVADWTFSWIHQMLLRKRLPDVRSQLKFLMS